MFRHPNPTTRAIAVTAMATLTLLASSPPGAGATNPAERFNPDDRVETMAAAPAAVGDRLDLTGGTSRCCGGFTIGYDLATRTVQVTGHESAVTKGTAIIVSMGDKGPHLRINLVATDTPGGDLHTSKDYPLWNQDGSAHVERIEYQGGDEVDQFSNYTAIPLSALGGHGDDFFLGGSGPDELSGQSGNDLIRGGEGDDELRGGLGNDVLRGEGGDDILEPYRGSDTSYGGPGDDLIEEQHSPAGGDQNLLCGNDGSDVLIGDHLAGTLNRLDGENPGAPPDDGDVDVLDGASTDEFEFSDDTVLVVDGVEIAATDASAPVPTTLACGNG